MRLIHHKIDFLSTKTCSSWNNFYKGINDFHFTTLYGYNNISSLTSAYVLNSFVSFFEAQGAGGAILFNTSNPNSYLLVEFTTIVNCISNGEGGGIFYGSKGNCILSKLCGCNCSTINHNKIFASLTVTGYKNKNEIYDSSFSYSKKETKNYMIHLSNGKIVVKGVNSSYNTCNILSGISLDASYSGSSSELISGTTSYSVFSNNTAKSSGIVFLDWQISGNAEHVMISCNIIANDQSESSTSYGVISATSKATIKNSCIIDNKGKYMFKQYNNYVSIFQNCTVDSGYELAGTTLIELSKPETSFMNIISCLSTAFCEAQIAIKTSMKKNYFRNNTCRRNHKTRCFNKFVQIAIFIRIIPTKSLFDAKKNI